MAALIRAWYDPAPAGVVFTASLLLGDLAARVFRCGRLVALDRILSWRVGASLVAALAAALRGADSRAWIIDRAHRLTVPFVTTVHTVTVGG